MGNLRNKRVDKAAKVASSLHYVNPQLLPTKTDLFLFIKTTNNHPLVRALAKPILK